MVESIQLYYFLLFMIVVFDKLSALVLQECKNPFCCLRTTAPWRSSPARQNVHLLRIKPVLRWNLAGACEECTERTGGTELFEK
jgi:hypothetical protein